MLRKRFIFWRIYAHTAFDLSSGESMLTLGFVYLLEHLCSPLVWFIFWIIYAHTAFIKLRLIIDAPEDKPS
jgi:hypothetical protein